MLFSDQRQHKLVIPAHDKDSKPVTISYLIDHLCQHVMKDSRKELFVLDNHMYVPSSCCPPCPPVVQRPCHSLAGQPACACVRVRVRVGLCVCVCVSYSFSLSYSRHYTRKAFLMHLHPPINKKREKKSRTEGLTLKPFLGSSPSRPGILVLINDADWELEGEESYEIQSGDNILFVSTLHGGEGPALWKQPRAQASPQRKREGV